MSDRSSISALTEWLRTIDVRAEVFARPDLCGRWTVNTGIAERACFHVLTAGEAWLHRRNLPPVPMQVGDVAFVGPGLWHTVSATAVLPDANWPLPTAAAVEAQLVCGWLDVSMEGWAALIDTLPDATVLRAGANCPELSGLGQLLSALSTSDLPGSQAVLDRLAEVIFLLVLRDQLMQAPSSPGLLLAISEPRLSRVLQAVHAEPALPWSLQEMAQLAHMSRTAFSVLFRETVGQTPAVYVQHWRMQRARQLLRDSRMSVIRVAEACGYKTEAAFRKAFRQVVGDPPCGYRKMMTRTAAYSAV